MEKWKHLCEEILVKIDEINHETVWQDVEPDWWLHMMEVRRTIIRWE